MLAMSHKTPFRCLFLIHKDYHFYISTDLRYMGFSLRNSNYSAPHSISMNVYFAPWGAAPLFYPDVQTPDAVSGEPAERKKPGRKPAVDEPKSKRTAQNRAAQRAYRERKEKYAKELETRVAELEQQLSDQSLFFQENLLLKRRIDELEKFNHALNSSVNFAHERQIADSGSSASMTPPLTIECLENSGVSNGPSSSSSACPSSPTEMSIKEPGPLPPSALIRDEEAFQTEFDTIFALPGFGAKNKQSATEEDDAAEIQNLCEDFVVRLFLLIFVYQA